MNGGRYHEEVTKTKSVEIGDWNVSLISDEDGHLSVYLAHKDGTEVVNCQADIGNECEWAERFTTKKIEEDFLAEEDDDDE
jgi:hypothetical protein